jgi:hypothetical protein
MANMKPEGEKTLFNRFKDMINVRDEDYFFITAWTILPIGTAGIATVLLWYLTITIWGAPIRPLHGKLIVSLFFFLSSVTPIIWMVKRQMPGSFFTVRRGILAVIVGGIFAAVSIFGGFYLLWEALKIMLGF